MFLQIISTIVAVAASYFLGPVLGNIVSQGYNNLIGVQDGFSFKSLAISTLAAGVSKGLQGVNAFGEAATGLAQVGNDIVRGALSSGITQGIARVTGLQDSFSWSGVAAAGISAGVGGFVSRNIGGAAQYDGDGNLTKPASFGHELAVSSASAIANAATRSAIKGSSFGDNLIASIPDVIGQAVGRTGAAAVGRPGGVLGDIVDIFNTPVDVVGSVVAATITNPIIRMQNSARDRAGSTATLGNNGGADAAPGVGAGGGKLGALKGGQLGISSDRAYTDVLGNLFDMGTSSINYGENITSDSLSYGQGMVGDALAALGFDDPDASEVLADGTIVVRAPKYDWNAELSLWGPALSQLDATNMRVSQTLDARGNDANVNRRAVTTRNLGGTQPTSNIWDDGFSSIWDHASYAAPSKQVRRGMAQKYSGGNPLLSGIRNQQNGGDIFSGALAQREGVFDYLFSGFSELVYGQQEMAQGAIATPVMTATGTADMITRPKQTARGIAAVANDPSLIVKQYSNAIKNADYFAIGNLFLGEPAMGAIGSGVSVSSIGRVSNVGGVVPDVNSATTSNIALKIHGNSKFSLKTAYLYRLEDDSGNLLKWGITQNENVAKRYTNSFLSDKFIRKVDSGTRADMLIRERELVTENPGPLNKEPWAKAARAAGRGQ